MISQRWDAESVEISAEVINGFRLFHYLVPLFVY